MSISIIKPMYCRRPFEAEEFLYTVRQFPFLYDKNEAQFKDTRLKEKHWSRIGAAYGMKGEACCNKFKNMKDRYTKLVTAIQNATAVGDRDKAIKCIRWKLFPIIHELLSSTPFSKNLPIDIKELLSTKAATAASSPSRSVEDGKDNNKDFNCDLVKCELNEEEDEGEESEEREQQEVVELQESGKRIIISANDSTQSFRDDDDVTGDSQPRYGAVDEVYTIGEEPPLRCLEQQQTTTSVSRQVRERARDSPDNVGQALEWAAKIIEAVENRHQEKRLKLDTEEEEISHFTSYLKHRLLKMDRKKRLKIVHDIEIILYKEDN